MGKWVGLLEGGSGRIQAGGIHYRWIQPLGAGPYDAEGWRLSQGDRFFAADINGDGSDEIIVVSPNGEWVGIIEPHGNRYVSGWIGHDWITYPGGGGGWNLGGGDKYHIADVDGNGKDKIIIVSGNGEWIGILEQQGNALRARWLGHDWVRYSNRSGGWNLGLGDKFHIADVDGDRKDEIIAVSGNGQWIGIFEERNGGLNARWLGHDWVNPPGGSGNSGWNLRQGDKFYVADIDGDGKDELIVISQNGQWIGILHEHNNTLRAAWIGHDWVNPPGGSGNSGWNLRQGDKFYVADIDGDGKDELIVRSSNGQWIGILHEHNNTLKAGWIGHDWVNPPGGSGNSGWNLKQGDKFYVSDIDGDGKDEFIVRSSNGEWVGILQEHNNTLKAGWIGHDWVNPAGSSGNTGWNLKLGDTFIPSNIRLLATSPWGSRPIVRLHLKILTTPTIPIADMVAEMVTTYASRGIGVEIASTENLNLPDLDDIDVGQCLRGVTTDEQDDLFRNRNFVQNNEVVVYFVNSTVPANNGCAAHPRRRPGAVVARIASRYTLAHEIGHVLGLNHVNNNNRLMTGNGTFNITNPPPNLTSAEGNTMKDSNLTMNL